MIMPPQSHSIEGRIRDLALGEVFQLLARGRKTGVLRCDAPLLSREAQIGFAQGVIVDAAVAAVGRLRDGAVRELPAPREIEEAALDVLCWKDGTFRFLPAESPAPRGRLAVEPLLIEAAQRALVWDQIEARVPHARVVPAFEDLEPGQLPELRLSPAQWEVLAHVDGERDLVALATVLQRAFTDVAQHVHDLIAIGLLAVRETPVAPRRNPTPPTNAAFPPLEDLWIPDRLSGGGMRTPGEGEQGHDTIFDPVRVGVLTPEGLPALDLPAAALATRPTASAPPSVFVTRDADAAVAPAAAEPSVRREQVADTEWGSSAPRAGQAWCREGDERLRHGDLLGAVACWEAAIGAGVPDDDAERLRDVIALATRLHALVPI